MTVCGTASSPEPPTELTWALLLGLARHIPAEARAVREGGPWQSTVGADLAGRTLGLVGLGKIGGRVARIGHAFGMDAAAWNPNLTLKRAAEHGVRLAKDKPDLLAGSDFVSLHLVLSDRTRRLIREPELRAMHPSCLPRKRLPDGTRRRRGAAAGAAGGVDRGGGLDV
nr:NAD(P)-dependent oxidoreductase [Streptomyces sp. MB09-01]